MSPPFRLSLRKSYPWPIRSRLKHAPKPVRTYSKTQLFLDLVDRLAHLPSGLLDLGLDVLGFLGLLARVLRLFPPFRRRRFIVVGVFVQERIGSRSGRYGNMDRVYPRGLRHLVFQPFCILLDRFDRRGRCKFRILQLRQAPE